MQSSKSELSSKENLDFDFHTIRLFIGLIAIFFPAVVCIRASEITPSISWSYHTDARDFFVGLLFVIGAFLISYKGHKPELEADQVGRFWKWLGKYWKGAISVGIWEGKHEEDLISWVGGIAAWVTALYPTAYCNHNGCPPDPKSTIHYIAAIILFSTTVYFCLVAFTRRAKLKINKVDETFEKPRFHPVRLRIRFYRLSGWGIAVIMLGAVILKLIKFDVISNLTFWAETAALILFGIAWLVASQYLPLVTYQKERQKTFLDNISTKKSAA